MSRIVQQIFLELLFYIRFSVLKHLKKCCASQTDFHNSELYNHLETFKYEISSGENIKLLKIILFPRESVEVLMAY